MTTPTTIEYSCSAVYDHADNCQECRSNPADMCPMGKRLLLKAVEAQREFKELPIQSRGLAATAKIGRSETGISTAAGISLPKVSERLPGAGGCNSPLMSKSRAAQVSDLGHGKTGYVLTEDNRQVPSPIHLCKTKPKSAAVTLSNGNVRSEAVRAF